MFVGFGCCFRPFLGGEVRKSLVFLLEIFVGGKSWGSITIYIYIEKNLIFAGDVCWESVQLFRGLLDHSDSCFVFKK